MPKRENILPYSSIGDILSEKTGLRVSKDAKIELANYLEDFVKKIVGNSILIATSQKRKTIKEKDIKFVVEKLN